ncbi:hypothetical protein OS493_016922 [Desmophyllum pertusum]|uniref:C2 domain-containing protein n=1 Tax=Desmophyllum pertusum TaxID=174260 RepID=A0A9X0CKN8_9CNID|nr:hypothetical protein OS493_016922 [Desmophyllum pertusum]
MSIAAWVIAYILIGLLLLITIGYVGVLSYKAYVIRRDNRKLNYGFIIGTPSELDEPVSATDTPPSPKRLEASVKPPTEPPYSVGEVHEVRVQPLLVRRSVTEFPSLDRLPVSPTPGTPLSPGMRSPSTPSFFDDLGSLDPSLYTMIAEEDENALTTDNPNRSPSPHNLGQAHFIVNYDQHRSVLMVRLVKALNLSPFEKEWSKPCNPYVIVQLLPDYRHQLQSTVLKKTTNPRFDETFEFELSYKELQLQTLWLTFLSFDSSSRHDVIGQVVLPLADLSLSQDNVFRTDIRPSLKKQVALGELMVSLGYLKSAERLTVVVIKARNLPAVNIKGSDPYVKVYLLTAGKRVKKKKTSIRKGTLNPVFNEAVSFDIAMDTLNSVDLLLSVMHENEVIGCVPIGAHATGKELGHWREVRTANKPVAHWHLLQDPKKFY